MKSMILLTVLFAHSVSFGDTKDSINYHEIKDAVVCFDCINRNQEMLRQVIVHLERLDSTKVTVFSRGSYYFDLSMAFSLLTEIGEDYFQLAKKFAYRAIHYGGYPTHFLHAATLFHKEGNCDSMEVCLKQYVEKLPKNETINVSQISRLRTSCVPVLK